MKKTKVIIPALGMLLLSTAASVTGTVAWFAASSSVTATGMAITATTDSEFLVINKTSDLSDNLQTVSLAAPSGSVLPTNWVDNSGFKWVSGAGAATDDATLTGGYTSLDPIVESGNFGSFSSKKYYVFDTVYVGIAVGSATPASKKLVCSASFSIAGAAYASNLNKCLTVAVDSTPTAAAAEFEQRLVMGATGTAGTPTVVAGSNQLIAGSSLTTTGLPLKIYAFYNGDDENCTTANAIALGAVTINLTFSLVDAA